MDLRLNIYSLLFYQIQFNYTYYLILPEHFVESTYPMQVLSVQLVGHYNHSTCLIIQMILKSNVKRNICHLLN
jgi:hypothetical protein